MKLCQGQVWKQGREYIRIVRLERLEVEYKTMKSLADKKGARQITSKKDFCRMIKQARLLTPKNATSTNAAADGDSDGNKPGHGGQYAYRRQDAAENSSCEKKQ